MRAATRCRRSNVDKLLCYEDLLAAASRRLRLAGVRREHRIDALLHIRHDRQSQGRALQPSFDGAARFGACSVDCLRALTARNSILVVVPLFHANAWSMPFSAAMCGAKLVLPGPRLDPESIYMLLRAGGLHHGGRHSDDLAQFPRLARETIGAARSVTPETEQVFLRRHRAAARHDREIPRSAWRVPAARLGHDRNQSDRDGRLAVGEARWRGPGRNRRHAGQAGTPDVWRRTEARRSATGRTLPHDGKAVGELKVRGNWVISGYFKGEGGQVVDEDGWFGTGDVATIDPDGYVQLTDRLKDVIKSGGEWISSIEIENLAVSHPDVFEAAVIAIASSGLAGASAADRSAESRARTDQGVDPGFPVRARSPNGGCPTMWCSSRACRTPRPASC